MPNRILKESICTSDSVNSLSWFEEVFFYRLIVNCDDYGRCDARPKILKSKLFPLKDIREEQVVNALYRLSLANIIIVYMDDERPYLQLRTWGNHQQIRNKRSRYPELSDSRVIDFSSFDKEKMTLHDFDIICNQLKSNDINCNQLQSNDRNCSRNPIQSESNPNLNLNPNICSELENLAPEPEAEPEPKAVITLPLNTGKEYPITEKDVELWSELYPAVDIRQELRHMKGWLNANPTRRKTVKGILRFINSWLAREQDKGGKSNEARETRETGRYPGTKNPTDFGGIVAAAIERGIGSDFDGF